VTRETESIHHSDTHTVRKEGRTKITGRKERIKESKKGKRKANKD
jgi:hypothetical protein